MAQLTLVTITVPLTIPLSLVNEIEAEASRSNVSIPDMLSCMLVDAMSNREQQEYEEAAAGRIINSPLLTTPSENFSTPPGGGEHFNGAASNG